jgi:hypothetical protein
MCVTPIARLGTSVSGSAATVCAYTDVGMVYCVSCEIQTSLKFRRYACLNKPLDDPSQVAMLDRYASIQCCLVSLYLDALCIRGCVLSYSYWNTSLSSQLTPFPSTIPTPPEHTRPMTIAQAWYFGNRWIWLGCRIFPMRPHTYSTNAKHTRNTNIASHR